MLGAALAGADRLQLLDRLAVAGSIHGAFGFDECVEAKDAAFAEFHIDDYALLLNGGELPYTEHFAETIEDAEVGFQIEILQAAALLTRQL